MPPQLWVKLSCVILSLPGHPLTGLPAHGSAKGTEMNHSGDRFREQHLLYRTGGAAYVVEAFLL